MKPLLANPALKPSAADVRSADAMAQDLLRLRFSTKLFRLGNAAAINAKVSFPVSGTADAKQGVIVMRIDDTKGVDVDPALRGAVVVFNATPDAVTQKVPGLTGAVRAEPGPGERRRQRRQAGGIRRGQRLVLRARSHGGGLRPAELTDAASSSGRSPRRAGPALRHAVRDLPTGRARA